MNKILIYTLLFCFLSFTASAEPYVPDADSESTLLVLKKYRDIFNDKYGVLLTKNNEIISEESDGTLKAKIFLNSLDELGYSPNKTFDTLLNTYKVSFVNHERYKSNPKIISYLFKIASEFILSNPNIAEEEYNITKETQEKINFYVNFYSILKKLDMSIINENEEEARKIISLMKKYWNNELFRIRMSLLQYFGIMGTPQDKEKALKAMVRINAYNEKYKILNYESKNALSSFFLYHEVQQPNFIWEKANTTSSAATDLIAAHYAVYNTDFTIINKLRNLAQSSSNDFSTYVSNMIMLELESGGSINKRFLKSRDEAKAKLVPGWTKKAALQHAFKNSLAGLVFYCIAPKDEEINEILTNTNQKQKEYSEKFNKTLELLSSRKAVAYYKNRNDEVVLFNIKTNFNDTSIEGTISNIKPEIKKHPTLKLSGTINRRPFAYNAIKLNSKIRDFLDQETVFLSLQSDGNLSGINRYWKNIINIKFPNAFLEYVMKGNLDEVTTLLNYGTNPNTYSPLEVSALSLAASNGYLEIVKLLIDKGADIKSVDIYGNSALHFAVRKNHKDIVEFLLKKSFDVNALTISKNTPLIIAAYNGNIAIAKLLLENKANINLRAKDGLSALSYAIVKNNLELVKVLLDHGAKLNEGNDKNWTPLMEAIRQQKFELVEFLIENGADISQLTRISINKWSTLMIAAHYGNVDIVRLLIENGANIKHNASGLVTRNAFTTAKEQSHSAVIALLNTADRIQLPIKSLHTVASTGKIDSLKQILKSDFNINGKNDIGETALTIATQNGHADIVELLLQHGAKSTIKNTFGSTALQIASSANNKKIIELLQNAEQKELQSDSQTSQGELQTSQKSAVNIVTTSKNEEIANQAAEKAAAEKAAAEKAAAEKAAAEKAAAEKAAAEKAAAEKAAAEKAAAEKAAAEKAAAEKAAAEKAAAEKAAAEKAAAEKAAAEKKIALAKPTAPAPKKPGTAYLVPTNVDVMSLTAFIPDQKIDSCIHVIALNASPLTAIRLESMGGVTSSWKTKDVKTSALGVLAVQKEGKIINSHDASFALDVTKETPLTLCVQDNGALNDTQTRLRIIFYHKDGSRNYSIIKK